MGLEEGRSGGEVAARRRWNMLAQAVRSHGRQLQPRGSHLGLISVGALGPGWFTYSCSGASLLVRHVTHCLTPEDLMGFNNTGNVCVWPSEEVLAFLVMSNLGEFTGKSVLELGGGMSCLAGLFVAKCSHATRVHLTDGNKASVENVRKIVEKNNMEDKVSVEALRWCDVASVESYDIVLAADCLFFEDTRESLVRALWNALKPSGFALVTAPRRGSTLDKFVSLCRTAGFNVTVSATYSEAVWQQHLALLRSPSYNPDSHYPILIRLEKF